MPQILISCFFYKNPIHKGLTRCLERRLALAQLRQPAASHFQRQPGAYSSEADPQDKAKQVSISQGLLMANWLRENLPRVVSISYAGQDLTVPIVLAQHRLSLHELTLRDQVFQLAAGLLAGGFAAKYPDYPRFTGMDFTIETMPQAAEAALRAITGASATRPAQIVLDGLGLARMENGQLIFSGSLGIAVVPAKYGGG